MNFLALLWLGYLTMAFSDRILCGKRDFMTISTLKINQFCTYTFVCSLDLFDDLYLSAIVHFRRYILCCNICSGCLWLSIFQRFIFFKNEKNVIFCRKWIVYVTIKAGNNVWTLHLCDSQRFGNQPCFVEWRIMGKILFGDLNFHIRYHVNVITIERPS